MEGFNNHSAFYSSKYDSLATLSAQLRHNMELSTMISRAAQELPLSKSAALEVAMNAPHLEQYSNVVPDSM